MNTFFEKPSRIKRQLSVIYNFEGKQTSDDPIEYIGKERISRMTAVIDQFGWTGYAKSYALQLGINDLEFEKEVPAIKK